MQTGLGRLLFHLHDHYWLKSALHSQMETFYVIAFFSFIPDKRLQHTEHPVSLENAMLWREEQRSALHYDMNVQAGKKKKLCPRLSTWKTASVDYTNESDDFTGDHNVKAATTNLRPQRPIQYNSFLIYQANVTVILSHILKRYIWQACL